jgi:hypothetical protein
MATFRERMLGNRALSWTVATATGIVAISGALAVIGVDTPRPAWASELQIAEAKIQELDSIITSQQLEDTTLRLYQNLREQNIYKREDDDIPNYLLEEQSDLEIRKFELEKRLDLIYQSTN